MYIHKKNFYIYLSGCILLLIVNKLTERILRMAKTQTKINELSNNLRDMIPEKNKNDKKND